MIGNLPVSANDLSAIAKNGSPAILHAVGRAFGLGADEREALTKGDFPTWFWVIAGLGAGVFAGAYVHKKWPHAVDKILKKAGA